MNILRSLKIEFSVILGIIIFGTILQYQECVNLWKIDIGSFIAAIGAMWIIASFFKLYASITSNLISLAVAGLIFLLGFGIHEYGFFAALIMVGFGGLYLSYLANPIYPIQASVSFAICLILVFIGLILTPFNKPTDPKKYYEPIIYKDIEWKAFVYYQNEKGDSIGTNLNTIVGNEESAYKQTRSIVEEWKKQNPAYKIEEVQVRIPEKLYSEAYANGYVPTHSLFQKYQAKFVPSWCDLRDLKN